MLDLHARLAAEGVPHEKAALQRRIDITDQGIDALVYELYGLTPEERWRWWRVRADNEWRTNNRMTARPIRAFVTYSLSATDRQIDALVYELYGLTPEEIAVVEGDGPTTNGERINE